MAGKSSVRDQYHHGQLRDALTQAALRILEAEGLEALSLRRVAAMVGVSHSAPAHHFPTLRALHTALAAIGFARFESAMRLAREAAPPDPVEQMRAACRGYLAYATTNPALFRLMFTFSALDWDEPALCRISQAAYDQLAQIVAPAAARLGLTSPEAVAALERLVWSQIHGEAHLMIDKKLAPVEAGAAPVDLAALLFAAPRVA
jgi:AcrR family transcriptional regulator